MTTVLEAQGLNVNLGGRLVLSNVDLQVNAGELTGLIGPNGAGKTTFLRSILGLVKSQSGKVNIAGEVGYVPQRHEFAWDFPISVHDVVLLGRIKKIGWLRSAKLVDYQATAKALERVGMSHLAKRTAGELSGGQRQRVLVARALALEPKLLLLDEPFTGLDVPTQELLLDLFKDLAADGHGVLMTTHDLVGAMFTCDKVCLLKGKVVACGSPAEVSDPALWMRTFGVKENSPLLKSLGI